MENIGNEVQRVKQSRYPSILPGEDVQYSTLSAVKVGVRVLNPQFHVS